MPEEETNQKGKILKTYQPYTIQLKRKDGQYYLHLCYDEKIYGSMVSPNQQLSVDLIAGIDINIDRIAVTILTNQGNFLKSKVFYCHELEYVAANKRDNMACETAKQVIEYLLAENVGAFVIEDIQLKQNHDTNNKFRRLTHNFAKNKIQSALFRRGLKNGLQIKKINPAYTSVIGKFKYAKQYGLSTHEAAALVIGRRGLGFAEKIPRALLKELLTKVKPYLIKLLTSMEESEKTTKESF